MVPVLLMRLVMLLMVPGVVSLVVWLDVRVSFTWPSLVVMLLVLVK